MSTELINFVLFSLIVIIIGMILHSYWVNRKLNILKAELDGLCELTIQLIKGLQGDLEENFENKD